MDISCLVGLCSAVAQTATDATQVVAAAAAASAPPDAPTTLKEDVGFFVTGVGVVSVILAQLRSNRVVRRYGESLLGFMGVASQKALGRAAPGDGTPWDADSLLAGIDGKRRAVLGVLTAVVAVYSLAAALVLIVHAEVLGNPKLTALSVAVSFLMFASFSGPVVMLGVSASNFGRLFWTYFAPVSFAAVAMQVMVGSVEADEKLSHVLWALFAVLLLTGVAVALREWVPRPLQLACIAWLKRHPWLGTAVVLLGLFVLLIAFGVSMRETSFFYLVGGTVVGALAIALCYYTLVDRIRRIVAPLLAAGYFAAIAAAFGVLELALPGEADPGWAWVLLAWVAAIAAGWLARNFMLSWIGLAYEQKVFSDAQFQVFCWMISVSGVIVCVGTLTRGEQAHLLDPINLWLLAATVLALVVYWAVTRYLMQPLASNKRLLVLRVFSRDRRGERLLDELEYRWRFIGPIVLIAGKDVAERTIDPAKAANFLRGRLKDIFVPNLHVLNKQVVAMDETPDPDGRYRVNEFFCFDDLWKEAVRRLLDSSDAIVLDLSEFTADRQGTAYELGLLMEREALSRTVFLVSAMTDIDAVRASLHVPPGSPLPVEVIQVERSLDGKHLVQALVRRIPVAPHVGSALPQRSATQPQGIADHGR